MMSLDDLMSHYTAMPGVNHAEAFAAAQLIAQAVEAVEAAGRTAVSPRHRANMSADEIGRATTPLPRHRAEVAVRL